MTIARRPGRDVRRLLGEMLVEAGLLTRRDLETGLEEQRLRGVRLGYALMQRGLVTPAELYLFLRRHFGVLSPDLFEILTTAPAVDLIPARLAHHYGMIPVQAEDGVLALALGGADSPRLLHAVEELTGLRVDPIICPPALIAAALERFYPSEVEPGVWYRAFGDGVVTLSERRRGIRPLLPGAVRPDAASSAWLRALAVEAIRRGARSLRLVPRRRVVEAGFIGADGEEEMMHLPRGPYAGLAGLIEGLARLASRGRVVPREGRILMQVEGRRIAVSVRAIPGLEGEGFTLDLRAERVAPPAPDGLAAEMPVLAGAVDRLVSRGHGLLLLAGTSVVEVRAALGAVLACLQDRLPRRAVIGDWAEHESLRTLPAATDGEEVPVDLLLQRALGDDPAILALPWLDGADRSHAALRQARERVVIAPLDAADAARAAGQILQVGHGEPGGRIEATDIGILGARVMERLCEPCRRPCDPAEILAAAGAGDAVAHGPFFMSEGCSACRGSGILALEPVFEFLDLPAGRRPQADAGRGAWNGRAAPHDATLFHAALRKAAAGVIDAREPIRFLLHEQS